MYLVDVCLTLQIILFLTRTLKRSLVQRLLAERPDAVNVYIHYLFIRLQTSEITDILTYVISVIINDLFFSISLMLDILQNAGPILDCCRKYYCRCHVSQVANFTCYG